MQGLGRLQFFLFLIKAVPPNDSGHVGLALRGAAGNPDRY